MPFQAGWDKAVKWTPLTGNPLVAGVQVTLNITGWSEGDSTDLIDVTSTGSLGIQQLIAAIQRGECRIQGFVDNSVNLRSAAIRIRSGTNGLIEFQAGYVTNRKLPVRISQVNLQSAVAGAVQFDFVARLDTTSGAITEQA